LELSYGVLFLGAALGGLVVLVLFSLMTLAQEAERFQDHLELKLGQSKNFTPAPVNERLAEKLLELEHLDLGLVTAADSRNPGGP